MFVGPSSWAAVVIAIASACYQLQAPQGASELRTLTPAVIQCNCFCNHTVSVDQQCAEAGPIIGSSGPAAWLGPLCYSVLGAIASRLLWASQLLCSVVWGVASYVWGGWGIGETTSSQEAVVASNAAVLKARARAQRHGRAE